jgi:hypothetical protein
MAVQGVAGSGISRQPRQAPGDLALQVQQLCVITAVALLHLYVLCVWLCKERLLVDSGNPDMRLETWHCRWAGCVS